MTLPVECPRPDAEVLHDLVERLEHDPRCRDARVGVAVVDDIVSLTGEVGSVAQKRRIEHAAHHVPGVRAVASELVAVRPEAHSRDDYDLARDVAALLRIEGVPAAAELEVTVSRAVVTLEGRVDWPFQRQQVVRAVSELPGVERVEDRIGLTERVTARDVRCSVAAELQRQAARTARGIRVEVSDNHVTLTGRTKSEKEKLDVERAAWRVPGVLDVRNRLEVHP